MSFLSHHQSQLSQEQRREVSPSRSFVSYAELSEGIERCDQARIASSVTFLK